MKQLFVIFGLLAAGCGFAQDTLVPRAYRNHLSLSYANNAQIADRVNEAYFQELDYYKKSNSVFKISAAYSYQSQQGIEFGLQLGFGRRKDRYTSPFPFEISQEYYSAMPFAMKTLEFNRCHISTGGGIPFNIVSECRFSGVDYMEKNYRGTHEGGFTAGLNSITQLRFFITERLALTSSVQFGWMYADFGEKWEQKPVDPNYNPVWMTEDVRTTKQTVFTQPEFFFGVGFRL